MNHETFDCLRFEEQASDFLEGRLGGEPAAGMRRHAQQCAACGELLDALHAAMEALAELPAEELPPGFTAAVLARTSGGRREAASWGATLRSLGRMLWQPRLAMGLAVAWFGFALLLDVSGARLRNLQLRDLSPARLTAMANRTLHRTYARGVRYYNDLRVVYEIQAALHALRRQPAAARRARPSGQSSRPYNWNAGARVLAQALPAQDAPVDNALAEAGKCGPTRRRVATATGGDCGMGIQV